MPRATKSLATVMMLAALCAPAAAQRPAPLGEEEAKRVAELVRRLDSKNFPERERALKELERFGPRALPALQTAAKGPISDEVRRRLGQLIDKLEPPELKRIPPLIEQLRARQFRDREQAMIELQALGGKALPALRAAARSPDIEVARRAEVLIARILKAPK
jgi:hypothetical protein